MKTNPKGSFWMTSLLTGFVVLICLLSLSYGPKERLIPLIIGFGCLVFCVLLLLGEKFPRLVRSFDVSVHDLMRDRLTPKNTSAAAVDPAVARKTVAISLWALGYLILIFLVGFHIANPLFMVLFLKISGKISWPKTIILTVITWGFIYGLFDIMLKQEIFRGLLFDAYVPPL